MLDVMVWIDDNLEGPVNWNEIVLQTNDEDPVEAAFFIQSDQVPFAAQAKTYREAKSFAKQHGVPLLSMNRETQVFECNTTAATTTMTGMTENSLFSWLGQLGR